MFVQTEITPNPNSLKFFPGKKVSNDSPIEITDKTLTDNELIKNILSINGVKGVFLADEFLSVNKDQTTEWNDLKHIIISLINDFYSNGAELIIDKNNTINVYDKSTNVYGSLYITNKSESNNGFVDVKVTTDGGSTFYHVAKKVQIPPSNTLTLDKPINLESNDILRVISQPLPDSSSINLEVYASILEIT